MRNFMAPTLARNDQILRETRWLGAVIIPFLAVAFVILYFFAGRTKELFAWNIQPAMSAMLLAAAYLGGIVFFWQVVRGQRWSAVTVGFPAVATFATVMGLATILHWDRFTHGHIAFVAWATLYFVTPFLVALAWWRNRGADPGPQPGEQMLSVLARRAFGITGAITLVVGVALFLAPALMASVWSWALTPLTARVVAGLFALAGVEELMVAQDGRWQATRVVLVSQMVSLAAILLAILVSWRDFAVGKPATWLFVVGLVGLFAGLVWFYRAMVARARAHK